jgi:UPF0176 protein
MLAFSASKRGISPKSRARNPSHLTHRLTTLGIQCKFAQINDSRVLKMHIDHIAGYKFTPLVDIEALQSNFLSKSDELSLKGTILLSKEGININLAGLPDQISAFRAWLQSDSRFADISYHETIAAEQPYRQLKVKIKNEIITLRQPDVNALADRAPAITPAELKAWLDEGRDITLLDTRNDYEVQFGTFDKAVNLHINDFGHFPAATNALDKEKPVVMFCTGGIRCEKASLYMLNHDFKEVYQLDRGILGYFADVGGAHYHGECFVFDERVAVNPALESTGTLQCKQCQGPIYPDNVHHCR